ncbi:MAG TPA: response regulator [Candidatus Limnocylindrales bacterium]|nr:response regulator [Candidatus Limnocylindrales bacterium]
MPLKRILVIDDEPQVLQLIARILQRGGYEVRTATSGGVVLQAVATSRPDLLILDLSMPEPDGFEVLKALRQREPTLPVLVISGFLGGSMLQAAELFGAVATLGKTDVPELLLETVRRVIA